MFSLNKSAALSDVQSPPAPPHCLSHSARLKKLFLLPAQPPYSNLNTGLGQLVSQSVQLGPGMFVPFLSQN